MRSRLTLPGPVQEQGGGVCGVEGAWHVRGTRFGRAVRRQHGCAVVQEGAGSRAATAQQVHCPPATARTQMRVFLCPQQRRACYHTAHGMAHKQDAPACCPASLSTAAAATAAMNAATMGGVAASCGRIGGRAHILCGEVAQACQRECHLALEQDAIKCGQLLARVYDIPVNIHGSCSRCAVGGCSGFAQLGGLPGRLRCNGAHLGQVEGGSCSWVARAWVRACGRCASPVSNC